MGIADFIKDIATEKRDEAPQEIPQTDLKRVMNGKTYWHYSLLKNWDKNEDLRLIKTKDRQRLLKSLQKNGIKDDFEIGEDGTTYDGNHRLKGIHHLVSQGIRQAENGKSLEWVPVSIHNPQNEVEQLAIAAEGNNDDFAIWNKDAVANNKDLFVQIPGYEEMSFDFEDPVTFGEVFEAYDENINIGEEVWSKKKPETYECPNCHHVADKDKFIQK